MDGIEGEAGGSGEAPPGWDAEPHPWRRLAARTIDAGLFGSLAIMIVSLAIAALLPLVALWMLALPGLADWFILGPLTWILTAPLSARAIASWGTTPGKLLFGLKVVTSEGGRLTFGAALKRELGLLLWGIGLGLPLLSFLMAVRSYSELESDGASRWDAGRHVVLAREVKGWQQLGVIVGVALFLAIRISGILLQLAG